MSLRKNDRLQPAIGGLEPHISGDPGRLLQLAARKGMASIINAAAFCWPGSITDLRTALLKDPIPTEVVKGLLEVA